MLGAALAEAATARRHAAVAAQLLLGGLLLPDPAVALVRAHLVTPSVAAVLAARDRARKRLREHVENVEAAP